MPALPKPARRARQLTLFPPSRREPNWESLPAEIQQQLELLLSRMLCDHVARSLGAAAGEDGHE